MPEEIKYLDSMNTNKTEEISPIQEIKPLTNTETIKEEKANKKVELPSWNIEPPVEIQRNIE